MGLGIFAATGHLNFIRSKVLNYLLKNDPTVLVFCLVLHVVALAGLHRLLYCRPNMAHRLDVPHLLRKYRRDYHGRVMNKSHLGSGALASL